MRKNIFVYIITVLVFGSGIIAAIHAGRRLEVPRVTESATPAPMAQPAADAGLIGTLRANLHEPVSLLLAQLVVIVILARAFGALFSWLGQPSVVGEMLAGIVLGPSVVGALFPGAFNFMFPAASLGVLKMLSQVGVIIFMFLVGMELDLKTLRNRPDTALMVSHVGIIFPYFLGVMMSLFIYRTYAAANATFLAFALFMGIAMSITAFPVLARILTERGLTKTPLGAIAITCAAVNDVTAWCILAFVVAIVKAGGIAGSIATIVLALALTAVMLFVIRPLLNRLSIARPEWADNPQKGIVVGILMLVFSAALFTEVIGIHALFGAFLAGIAMPANARFRSRLEDRLEPFSSALLLPLFFAFTGLRTQIGLVSGSAGWLVCGGLILVATIGKLGGSMAAARWTGMSGRDSFALGALMNTRGLVELIVLNIGLDLGILSPPVFAMMVIMALVTTCMTGPLLQVARVTGPR